MLPFHWGIFGVMLLIAFTHGASINSAANEDNIELVEDSERSKRSYKRGQTQSQYLNFGQPELDGKADAEATEGGSRSTVSGTHGMGQAQSQFSSGDCSGCGAGSPLYEYSTGSPDPLTLGGNVISYSDGKPSSIIGLQGATPIGAFSPSGSFAPSSGGQARMPGAGNVFAPSAGGGAGQLGQPGISGGYAPGHVVAGVPGTDGSIVADNSGTRPIGRPVAGGASAPGSSYANGVGVGGQIGRPGSGGVYAPGSAIAPGTAGAGQIGRPGGDGAYAPGSMYTSGTGGTAQIGKPAADGVYGPGSTYIPGAAGIGQIGRPGTNGAFAPGGSGAGQLGRPGTDGSYVPGGMYAPGSGQIGTPSSRGAFASGAGSGQMATPSTGGTFTPGSAYPSGIGRAQPIERPGVGGGYPPISVASAGQIGTPGISFGPGYGPSGSGIGSGTPGFGIPGIGGIVQQGQMQPQPQLPQLIAPPAVLPGQVQGQQTGMGFGSQAPGYGRTVDQQGPAYTPGVPGKQQITQYPPGGHQLPTHGTDGRRPGAGATGQQVSTYGQPVQQIPGRQITHGPYYKPSAGFSPDQQQVPQHGTGQHVVGYPQQTGYTPGYGGVPSRGAGSTVISAPPETHYQAAGPQQILQQPGRGTISKPGTAGIQQGFGGAQQPSSGYGQPGTGGYQPGVGFGQSGGGVQQGPVAPSGGAVQPGIVFGQPGTVPVQGRISTEGKVIQPGTSFLQPGYGQQGGVQPAGSFIQPGGVQSGTGSIQPTGDQYQGGQPTNGFVQPGGVLPSAGFVQPNADFQPGGIRSGVVQPGFVQPGTGTQPTGGFSHPSLGTQTGTGHGQPGVGIQPEMVYSQPSSGIQHGLGGLLTQPTGALQPGTILDQRGIGYQPGTDSFGSQGGIPGTGAQQAPGFTPGYGSTVAVQPGTGSGYQPDLSSGGFVQPSIGTQPALHQPERPGVQHVPRFGGQVGQQPDTHVGGGLGPFTGAGYSPLPGDGVQQGAGVQQGSRYGSGFDNTYGQPGTGYVQPTGTAQYGQSGSALRQPDAGIQLPGAGHQAGYVQPSSSGATQYGQVPQQILQPGSTYGVQPSGVQQGIPGTGAVVSGVGGADDAFSQAESSIGNGQAAASAQGKNNGGTAKTQVQGTYSSSGSFSASAMTSDSDRTASSQVTGGVEGAMSQSQGQGGAAQSQAQVQLNEKTGGTKASSQSGGVIHQSQSEVQANDKGGLADAQSSGPGQTSSQAQIGFRPGQDGEIVRSAGGGQASAQSGVHYGNSQSQIQGASKYGVSYHGAAQSASGTKEQVATYREQNRDLFNTISQFGGTDAVTDRVDAVYNPALTSESDIPDLQLKSSKTNKEVANTNKLDDDSILPDDEEEEEPYDEYEDEEDYYNENPIKMEAKSNDDKKLQSSSLYRTHTQKSPTQSQQAVIADPSKKYNLVQKQNGRVQAYPSRTTTETVPNGFRGTVNIEKKFHTKSLESHKFDNKLNVTANEKFEHNQRTPDSFVTVTKSITGSMDNSKNPPQDNKNFQSTYYTKSSTCGYFTFSCNIVYGANGRSKICRPKTPTNGKC